MANNGIRKGGNVRHLPITDRIGDWESRTRREASQNVGGGNVEVGALFDKDGNPIDAFLGQRHYVNVDTNKFNNPETEDATFTHFHPDSKFGGTFSMADISVFATTNWGEMRAYTQQGQVYSIKAGPNADREALGKWAKRNNKLFQRNFNNSFDRALKEATTKLKSGPHAGKVKLTDRKTGRVTYRDPMSPQQADAYARQVAVGMFDRTYKKNLEKFGFTYTKTKSGRSR